MPYDALGNYIPGDEPSIDQMQYELAKKGQAPRPLDKVTEHFKNIVTQFNPIMMPKVMQDVGTIGTNIASTIVSPYADILSNVQASGAAGLHRLAGNEQAALEAEARQRPVTPSGLMREPNLPVAREFEQGLGKAFVASKLPPMGPGSGMPGSAPISPRPMFTPNDLRVVGAEATRVGRQIGDIPTDFANAQSGFQRIDPVTGQPVLGARIQSGVDRLGDIMEQRKMQGLTPIPGLPAALQPETSMYAVRPQGSRLTTPVVPETARGFSPPVDPANDMFREVTGIQPEQPEATPTLLHSLNRRVQFGNLPNDRDAINGFRRFIENKAKEMYPEAETPRQALEIFNAMHYDTPSRHVVENKIFDEFIQTPEGQQLLPNAVSSEEMAKRHNAAAEGLQNMWGKYLVKNLGTEGNPLVKIAAEKGLTQLPAEDVIRIANEEAYAASANRQKGGMPVQGSFVVPITNLQKEIEAINLPLQNAANAEQSLGQAAHMAGIDPASVPEYLEARKNAAKLNKQKNELQKKLDNLTLASAYEALEDAAVKPMPAETLLKEMQPSERPFYPGLKESAARGETSYRSAIGAIENTGFIQAAEKFYNDVLQGKIPADKAATYPVDKYIRENAEARIKVEQAEKAKLAEHKNAVMTSLKESADALPADKKFGNVGVVELTKDTPLDVANKEVAASTEALDICIGEGGSGSGTKNLFTGKKDPRYTPIVNLLTGEPNPNASRNTSGYVTELQRGEQLPMFRDLETGIPIAALQFHVASSVGANGQPKFNIGYASGAGNGRIEAKYINGVRDYLNSRADDIAGIGNNLEDNTGIYDTTNKSSLAKARRYAQVSENEMKAVDWNSMPRFMTAEDVKQAVKGNVPAVVQQSPAFQEDVARLQATLIDNIDTVVDDAVNHSNLDVPEDLDNRLHAVFARMRQEYFPTFADDPIPTMNRALDFLRDQIDRRANNASELSQEMVDALDNYAAELEAARDELLAQQQRAIQPAPQAPTRQITEENLRDAMLLNMPAYEISAHSALNFAFDNHFNAEQFRTNPRAVINNIREDLLTALQRFEEITNINELRNFGFDNFAERDQWVVEVNDTVDRLNQLEDSLQISVPAATPAPQAPQADVTTVIDNVLETAARELGADVRNEAERLLHEISRTYDPTSVQFRNAVRGYASPDAIPQQSDFVRQVMETLANELDEQTAQQTPQMSQMQQAEQLLQQIERPLRSTNDGIVNDSLQDYSRNLQRYISNQLQNGMSPMQTATGVRDTINTLRNLVLSQPTDFTRNFTPDQLGDYVSALRQTIDGIGQWIETQNQQAAAPQRANLPAEVQQNIDRRNQQITDAYLNVLVPNTNIEIIDQSLSEFADLLQSMSTNLYGAGFNTAEIVDRLQDRIRTEITELSNTDRVMNRGLNVAEADTIRSRLNTAYGNLSTIREMGVPAPEPMIELNFEPDTMHGANEPYTMQSAVDMARDLFEQERIDANNFDIRSIEDSIYALREGLFDDERIRRLSPRQQAAFSEDVAFRLQNMLDELRGRRPDRNLVDLVDLVADPADARRAIENAIINIEHDYDTTVADDVIALTNAISEHVNPGDELSEYVYHLRRNRPGMSEDVREALDHIAEELESIATDRQQQTQPMDLNTAYNTAEAYLNERLEDIGLDSRFADLTDAERAGIVNTYEDELGRTLNGLSDDDFLHVLRRLRENNPIPYEHQQALTPVPAQPATAPYVPLSNDVGRSSDIELLRHMDERENLEVQNALNAITDVNSPEQIQNIIGLARTHLMGPWQNFTAVQRERLARGLTQYLQDNTPPNTPPEVATITGRDRELYDELNAMLDNAIEEGYPLPDLGDNEAVARLILNDEVGGDINNATDAERRRLADLVRQYGAHGTLPRGHRDGGRIRAYKKGGRVHQFPSVEQMKHELMMRRA